MADSITLKSVQNNGSVTLVANNQTILLQGKAQGPQGIQGVQGDPATNLVTSVAGRQGVVVLDKTDVGLGNADNTSDLSKPISTATQTALDTKATTTALNAHTSNTSNPHSVTKAQVGLGNAENTSDADKPVSTAQQTALDTKANASDTVNLTGDQTIAGVKTFSSSPVVPTATTSTQAVNKSQMDTADALKVNKAGDTMTGPLRLTSSTSQDDYASFIYNGASNYSIFKVGNLRPTANNTIGVIGFFSLNSDGNQVYHSAVNTVMTNNTAGAVRSTIGLVRMENNIQINAFSANENRVLLGSNRVEFGGTANITGTGFPEGAISAPTGSIYIDKAVTNGASSWIKKSGTGNTGWQVLEGVVTKTIVLGDLINGWTFGTVTSMTLRREGNRVSLIVKDLSLTSTSATASMFMLLPAGYTASSALYGNYHTYGFINRGGARAIVKDFNNIGDYSYATSRGYYTGELSWITADAWPTS